MAGDKQLPSPRELADQYNLIPKKSLGQNFLFDLNITRKITNLCPALDEKNVIEIGPGPGGLTHAILEQKPKSINVVEFDPRAAEALKEYGSDINIIEADALNLNLREVAEKPRVIIANLPYNIGTKLLTNWLSYAEEFDYMALMFQKEVAERICAAPRSKEHGRLSVLSQWLCETRILFHIPPEAFFPAPKVTSSVVMLKPRDNKIEAKQENLELVVKTAFNQRRKMLKSSLKPLFTDVEKVLNSCEIDSKSRPEELSIEQFCRLSREL